MAAVRERFGDANVYVVSTRDLGDGVVTWRRETLERELAALVAEHRLRAFTGVVSWREPFVLIAHRVARLLELPVTLPDASLARDKWRMKEALRAVVRCAESTVIRSAADLAAAPARLFPGVLKPRYGFASICAVRVEDRPRALRELAEKRDKLLTTHLERVDLGVPTAPEFVLEPFVGGTEHTVESFVVDGEVVVQIVSDKLPMTPPHFVETGDLMPSALGSEAQSALREAARKAVAVLGVRSGWTHAEIKLWNGEAWVMEIAARMGGGYTRELVEEVYGLDMLEVQLDHALRGTVPVLGPPRGVALGRRIVVSGVTVVWDAGAIDRLAAEGRVRLVARESGPKRRGIFLGVPFSYAGTIVAYLVRAADRPSLDRLRAEIDRAIAPRRLRIPVPRALYRAYLVGKRLLEA